MTTKPYRVELQPKYMNAYLYKPGVGHVAVVWSGSKPSMLGVRQYAYMFAASEVMLETLEAVQRGTATERQIDRAVRLARKGLV